MVKITKLEVNTCVNAQWKSKARDSACSESFICNVISTFFVCTCPQTAFFVKVIAKVVSWVVRVAHSHILDLILAQTCTDVLEKFPF